ncbi:MAG: four helix bundle protein [Prevotella sp.]|nr:four helix bundle protein [Prevotella sp.]
MKDFYYRKLKVYHQSKRLVTNIYSLTKSFPLQEQYGLTNQIQRAAISVPSNIAEGMGRFSLKERIHFLEIAHGSLMEVMCQLEIAEHLNYITSEKLIEQENLVDEIAKMLIGLRKTIEEKNNYNN